jgi:hypothetical protein
MKLLSLAVLTSATAILTLGCLNERQYRQPYEELDNDFGRDEDFEEDWNDDEEYYGEQTELRLQNPYVAGDIGGVRDFDAPANDSYAYVDPDWGTTSITLSGYDSRGRLGMLILWMDSMDIRDTSAGRYTFNVQSGEGPGIGVTGCSDGDDSYYDQPATEGEVVIEDTAEGREVVVQTNLPSYEDPNQTTQATGSFIIVE